jgi:hypothetical protein
MVQCPNNSGQLFEKESPMSAPNPGTEHTERLHWWQHWRQSDADDAARENHPFFKFILRHFVSIYALAIALGVPSMGFIHGGFSIPYTQTYVDALELKFAIAAVWCAISHLFWMIQFEKIDTQMRLYGELGVQESDSQRSSMYYLYYAVFCAVGIWIAFAALFAFTGQYRPPAIWIGPTYGPVEIGLILHTWWVGSSSKKLVWPLISSIQQAVARQVRRGTPTSTS